jgi:eukaryotic-like serine/threonine-protein kinase
MHRKGGPAPASALPRIGQVISGKYELVSVLGEGGMALVFEAEHLRLSQRVAIKLLAPEFSRDAELVARFEREARAVAQLRTRHVPRVMDVETTEAGVPYIVMEFLQGRDLEAELEGRSRIPLGEAVDYVLQACAAMMEAHAAKIVHRDLKPANLFVARDGAETIVKVLDFGISKVIGESTKLTAAGAVMGTVLYMSPEQVRASSDVDARADIWSIGVILFELIAGRPPWQGSSQQIAAAIVSEGAPELRAFINVPQPLNDAVRAMLEPDPARRLQTVRDVVFALAPFVPDGTFGAVIAEQLGAGSSGPRPRVVAREPAVTPQSGVTVPFLPSLPIPPYLQPSSSPTPVAQPRASSIDDREEPGARRTRVFSIALAFVALLGIIGTVLIAFTMLRSAPRTAAQPTTATPPPLTALEPGASAGLSDRAEQPFRAAPDATGSAAPRRPKPRP